MWTNLGALRWRDYSGLSGSPTCSAKCFYDIKLRKRGGDVSVQTDGSGEATSRGTRQLPPLEEARRGVLPGALPRLDSCSVKGVSDVWPPGLNLCAQPAGLCAGHGSPRDEHRCIADRLTCWNAVLGIGVVCPVWGSRQREGQTPASAHQHAADPPTPGLHKEPHQRSLGTA